MAKLLTTIELKTNVSKTINYDLSAGCKITKYSDGTITYDWLNPKLSYEELQEFAQCTWVKPTFWQRIKAFFKGNCES